MFEPLIHVCSRDGFASFVFAKDLDIFVDGDGMIRIESPLGRMKEMLMSPTECRNALFEERDLWNC